MALEPAAEARRPGYAQEPSSLNNNVPVCDFFLSHVRSVQTDSTAFYDSLFANASTWGLMTAKHDHVSDNIPAVPAALEELGYLGRVLSAEHDGLVRS